MSVVKVTQSVWSCYGSLSWQTVGLSPSKTTGTQGPVHVPPPPLSNFRDEMWMVAKGTALLSSFPLSTSRQRLAFLLVCVCVCHHNESSWCLSMEKGEVITGGPICPWCSALQTESNFNPDHAVCNFWQCSYLINLFIHTMGTITISLQGYF